MYNCIYIHTSIHPYIYTRMHIYMNTYTESSGKERIHTYIDSQTRILVFGIRAKTLKPVYRFLGIWAKTLKPVYWFLGIQAKTLKPVYRFLGIRAKMLKPVSRDTGRRSNPGPDYPLCHLCHGMGPPAVGGPPRPAS